MHTLDYLQSILGSVYLNVVVQSLGIIALVSWVTSIQLREKKNILLFQLLATFSFCLHYFLLNAMSAAAVGVVSVIRLLTIYLIERKGRRVPVSVLVLLIAVLIGVGFFTYQTPMSLLPIVITIFYTYGTWQQNTAILRIIFFFCGWLWILYNYSVGSYILIAGNVLEIVSSGISLYRFGILGKRNAAQ